MTRTLTMMIAALALSASLTACTEACEDSCEQQYDVAACLESHPEAECESMAADLLTCVEACNR